MWDDMKESVGAQTVVRTVLRLSNLGSTPLKFSSKQTFIAAKLCTDAHKTTETRILLLGLGPKTASQTFTDLSAVLLPGLRRSSNNEYLGRGLSTHLSPAKQQ